VSQHASSPSEAPRFLWAIVFVWSAALVAAFVAFDPLFLNHDNALFLEYAAMLLDGAVPYVGFMDLNPPLVIYLNTIPVAIARAVGASPIPVFTLTVAALAAASAAWTFRLLGRPAGRRSARASAWRSSSCGADRVSREGATASLWSEAPLCAIALRRAFA
jgi:hypothetical protein